MKSPHFTEGILPVSTVFAVAQNRSPANGTPVHIDIDYFLKVSGAAFFEENIARLRAETLSAYRWQYILSGAAEPRFQKVLRSMITEDQFERIEKALAPIADSATVQV